MADTSPKHTPGPWTVDETKALGAYGVWTDYATHPGHDGAGYGSQICSFSVVSSDKADPPREQRDANAKLIAAAPDLLAACKSGLARIESDIEGAEHTADGNVLRAAIAKAEGRS